MCNDAPAPGALAGLLSLLFDDSMRRCLPELPPEAGLPVPDSWLKRLDMEGPFWQAHWLLWRLREAAGTETDTAACKALAESLTLQIKVAFDEVEFAPNESTSMTQLRLTGAIASLTSRPSVCTLWWDFVATLAAAATLNGSVSMEIATSTTDDGQFQLMMVLHEISQTWAMLILDRWPEELFLTCTESEADAPAGLDDNDGDEGEDVGLESQTYCAMAVMNMAGATVRRILHKLGRSSRRTRKLDRLKTQLALDVEVPSVIAVAPA